MDHYIGLFAAYAVITVIRLGILRHVPGLIPLPEAARITRPGRELAFLGLAVVAVIGVGQLHVAGLLLPGDHAWGGVTEAANQVLIFLPLVICLIGMKADWNSVLFSGGRLGRRLALGMGLAVLSLLVFSIASPANVALGQLIHPMGELENLHFPVQVFFEDLFIAACLARLAAALSVRKAVVLVAVLFAAGHIPALLATGAQPQELITLVADVILGAMVFGSILKTRDFAWIWPVHVVMDFTQLAF